MTSAPPRNEPGSAALLPPPNMFAGPGSLRVPSERSSLIVCLATAPLVIGIAHLIFPSVSISDFVLLIAVGLVFVSISRGRLIGSSIRIEGRQFPEIAELTRSLAARMGMPAPQVFVRDDPFVPIAAVGVGEPYALIISSQYYEHLRRGELAFLIARELGHIAAGHTRLASLLSASGRENPIVALVFGAWLRRTEFTADRVGLVCCDGLDDALGAIAITTFHAIGRRVDLEVMAEQQSEVKADAALRLGEWTAAVPYATNRLEALRAFEVTQLAKFWRERLAVGTANPVQVVEQRGDVVSRRDCAPLPRRIAAMSIDLAVIASILQTPYVAHVSKATLSDEDVPKFVMWIVNHAPAIGFSVVGSTTLAAFFIYSALLVALGGQTLGMTVMEVRVVTTHFRRPTIVQSFWRYTVALFSSITAIACAGFFVRVHPHDRLSRTRLIRGRKAG